MPIQFGGGSSVSWDCYSESYPVARKEHRCDDCFATIEKGEKYFTYRGKWDGNDFESIKQCLPCKAAATWLFDSMSNSGCWPEDCTYEVGDLFQYVVMQAQDAKSFTGYRHAVGIKRRNAAARQGQQ